MSTTSDVSRLPAHWCGPDGGLFARAHVVWVEIDPAVLDGGRLG